MQIERLMDQEVKYLSGGELQRVALVMALGKPADLYLIDEPSAYLDSEQRIAAAKACRYWIYICIYKSISVDYTYVYVCVCVCVCGVRVCVVCV